MNSPKVRGLPVKTSRILDYIDEVPAGIGRQNPAYLFGSAEFQKPLNDEFLVPLRVECMDVDIPEKRRHALDVNLRLCHATPHLS